MHPPKNARGRSGHFFQNQKKDPIFAPKYTQRCSWNLKNANSPPSWKAQAPPCLRPGASALEAEHKRRLQFYQDIDDDLKVEFINGEIVVHSPVKKEHTDATGFLYKILDTFVRVFKAGYVGYEKVMTALTRNDYEPDVLFFGPEKAAGFQKGQWKYPPPDFVVEVLSEGTETGIGASNSTTMRPTGWRNIGL